MIRELFDLTMSLGDTTKELGGTVRLDLTKRRIRSISAFSSNSIFYFPVATTNQCTQEEYTMVSRMLEKQYAAFVVACISLVPFHRIKADDQASVEEYLSQFHQNMGFSKGGRDFGSILAKMDSISESAMGDFFYQLWRESQKTHTNPVIHLRDNYKSLSESFGKHNVDAYAEIFTARQRLILEEMNEWGFIGTKAPESIYSGQGGINESYSPKYEYDNDSLDDTINKLIGRKPGYFQENVKRICESSGLDVDTIDYATSTLDDTITFESDDDNTFAACKFWFGDKYPEEPEDGLDDSDVGRLNKIASNIKNSIPNIKDCSVRYYPHDIRGGKIVVNVDPQPEKCEPVNLDKRVYDDSAVCSDVNAFNKIKCLDSTNISDMSSIEELRLIKDVLTRYIELYKLNLIAYKRKWLRNEGKKVFNCFMNTLYNSPQEYMKDYYNCTDIATDRINKIDDRVTELYRDGDFNGSPSERSYIIDNIRMINDDISHQEDFNEDSFIVMDNDEYDTTLEESAIFSELPDSIFYEIIDEADGGKFKLDNPNSPVSFVNDNKSDTKIGGTTRISNSLGRNDHNSRQYGRDISPKMRPNNNRMSGSNAQRNSGYIPKSGFVDSRKDYIGNFRRRPKDIYNDKNKDKSGSYNSIRSTSSPQNRIDTNNNNTKSKEENPSSTSEKSDNGNGGGGLEDFGPVSGVDYSRMARVENINTFDRDVFTKMDMQKANDALPTFAKCSVGFVIDGTEDVVMKDFLVGIKAYCHRVPSRELIDDLYQSIINKRKFLKFVKFVTGEESSLSDLLFGIKQLKLDALDNSVDSKKSSKWRSAIQRRKRWSDMAIPYLTKEYTPNMTIVITKSEIDFIKDHYGLDIMQFKHVNMLMDANFLLGFVVVDQTDETVKVLYDGHGYEMQEYSYAQLERENNASDRMMRELYRSLSR